MRQNDKTEDDGLERIQDDDDLADRIARKMLVPVPASSMLTVNPSLPENRRYCRPWTANFLTDLARAHAALFHHPLIVSSAVRTVEYQKRLMEINGNAAPAEGDIASTPSDRRHHRHRQAGPKPQGTGLAARLA